ncbi:MAG TPA: sensor histidine kinase [Thermomicrobiales bacterium]|nr:sensor histidine kinase [Thermomicrobiales bacterium]
MDDLASRLSRIADACAGDLENIEAALARADEELTSLIARTVRERDRLQGFVEEFALMGGADAFPTGRRRSDTRMDGIVAGRQALEEIDHSLRRATALRANVDLGLQVIKRCAEQLRGENAFENPFDADDLRLQLAMNTAREDERRRLAREIHDGPAQVLANAIFGVEIAEQVSRRSPENVVDELKGLRALLRDGVAEVRRFMFDLQPTMLADQGLVPTLQRYVADFNRFFGKQVELDLRMSGTQLSPDRELTIFRTVQEALQNFQKHAKVDQASVSLLSDHDQLELVVRDSGKGFQPDAVQTFQSGGSGLKGMRDRASLIGADIMVVSAPGKGTEIRLALARRPHAGERERA